LIIEARDDEHCIGRRNRTRSEQEDIGLGYRIYIRYNIGRKRKELINKKERTAVILTIDENVSEMEELA